MCPFYVTPNTRFLPVHYILYPELYIFIYGIYPFMLQWLQVINYGIVFLGCTILIFISDHWCWYLLCFFVYNGQYLHSCYSEKSMAEQSGVQILTGARDFSVIQNVQSGYRALAASNSMGTVVLSRSNMSRVSSVPLISIEGYEFV